jgi:hypothetical protein
VLCVFVVACIAGSLVGLRRGGLLPVLLGFRMVSLRCAGALNGLTGVSRLSTGSLG